MCRWAEGIVRRGSGRAEGGDRGRARPFLCSSTPRVQPSQQPTPTNLTPSKTHSALPSGRCAVGQLSSTRSDLLPGEFVEELSTLQVALGGGGGANASPNYTKPTKLD